MPFAGARRSNRNFASIAKFSCSPARTIRRMRRKGCTAAPRPFGESMFLRPLKRLVRRILASLGALAFLAAQFAFLQCPCLLASEIAAEGRCDIANASCCRHTTGDDSQRSCCCNSDSGFAGGNSGCTCTAPTKTPATAPYSPVQIEPLAPRLPLAVAPALSCGLQGAAWSNAFDLAAFNGPPGLRLHAILSVWRN